MRHWGRLCEAPEHSRTQPSPAPSKSADAFSLSKSHPPDGRARELRTPKLPALAGCVKLPNSSRFFFSDTCIITSYPPTPPSCDGIIVAVPAGLRHQRKREFNFAKNAMKLTSRRRVKVFGSSKFSRNTR